MRVNDRPFFMLLLLFQLGSDRYGIQSDRIVEIIPRVELKGLPRAPEFVAGLLDYRGRVVPVIDLVRLTSNRPAVASLSTRIVLVTYPDAGGKQEILGLIVEKATETMVCHGERLEASGVTVPNAPFLGDILRDDQGMIQLVTVEGVLSDPVRALLFEGKRA